MQYISSVPCPQYTKVWKHPAATKEKVNKDDQNDCFIHCFHSTKQLTLNRDCSLTCSSKIKLPMSKLQNSVLLTVSRIVLFFHSLLGRFFCLKASIYPSRNAVSLCKKMSSICLEPYLNVSFPWDRFDCGHTYARKTGAAWSLLTAASHHMTQSPVFSNACPLPQCSPAT